MFAVGALDAYFCDAYTDILAATLNSKSRHSAMVLPDFFYEIKLPVRAVLESYSTDTNWKWRMAARKLMVRENVIDLGKIQSLFNKFFRKGQRFFGDLLDRWIKDPNANKRLFGIAHGDYMDLLPAESHIARLAAKDQMEERYQLIFQRRHDCIHNCDRPKVSPQPLSVGGTVLKVIADVDFLVRRCDEHINTEFRRFLSDAGCPAVIIAQTGY